MTGFGGILDIFIYRLFMTMLLFLYRSLSAARHEVRRLSVALLPFAAVCAYHLAAVVSHDTIHVMWV